jgi:hypothetical protein
MEEEAPIYSTAQGYCEELASQECGEEGKTVGRLRVRMDGTHGLYGRRSGGVGLGWVNLTPLCSLQPMHNNKTEIQRPLRCIYMCVSG